MTGLVKRYARWLHTRWPAGHVEKLPLVAEDGSTSVPGLYVVGDITGIPLLKFSSDTGARAVQTIHRDPAFARRDTSAQRDGSPVLDLVIIGAGVSGVAAARFGLATNVTTTSPDPPRGKFALTWRNRSPRSSSMAHTGERVRSFRPPIVADAIRTDRTVGWRAGRGIRS